MARTLPNLVIGGVHKAGTTSLYTYLGKHPQICASMTKEIGFYGPLVFGRETESLDNYAKHFAHCSTESYRMEASPSYLYGRAIVADAIRRDLPETKVIMILRDPTDRLLSFYNRAVSKSTLPEDMSFGDYLAVASKKEDSSEHNVYTRGIREGRYIDYIEPWQHAFGGDLKIVFFEDLKADSRALTESIVQWLQLDTNVYDQSVFTVENKTVHYKNRRLHQFIRNFYIKSESFWRKNDALKKRLRSGYNRFNADKHKKRTAADAEAVAWLRDQYAADNQKLGRFLRQHGYEKSPDWLN